MGTGLVPSLVVLPIEDLPVDLGASKPVEGAQAPFRAITVLRLIVPTRFLAKSRSFSGHEEYVLLVAVRRVDLRSRSVTLVGQ